jgi:4'-phosphopantetheinyl transferase
LNPAPGSRRWTRSSRDAVGTEAGFPDPVLPSHGRPVALTGASADVHAAADGAWRLMSPCEATRAGTLRDPSDRFDFVAAHALARICAGIVLQRPAQTLTLSQRCEQCGGAHGRPRLAEAPHLHVTLSHTRGYVAAVAGTGPVGVDVERYPQHRLDPGVLAVALTPRETMLVEGAPDPAHAFARQWVRKEALIKAGVASLASMATLDLSELLNADERAEHRPGMRRGLWRGWCLLEWDDPTRRVLGAVAGRRPPRLGQPRQS